MTYHAESGDVGGVEILIVFSLTNGGRIGQYYAYVQLAEGVPDVPQVVPVAVTGDSISFELAGPYARISPFQGRVVGDSLIGRFQNGWDLRIGRRESYWR
jgi:hypothetical protein